MSSWAINVLLKDSDNNPVNDGFPGDFTFTLNVNNFDPVNGPGLLSTPPATTDGKTGFDGVLLEGIKSMFESLSYTDLDTAATDAGFTPPLSYDSIQVTFTSNPANSDVTPS